MAVIKQLKNDKTNELLFPISKEKAIYDDNGDRLDNKLLDISTQIEELQTSFQDGCNIIMDAVTAKGQTPASNSPTDIAQAISNLDGSASGEVELYNALKYSGLVTEDMNFDEMCTALLQFFPPYVTVIDNTITSEYYVENFYMFDAYASVGADDSKDVNPTLFNLINLNAFNTMEITYYYRNKAGYGSVSSALYVDGVTVASHGSGEGTHTITVDITDKDTATFTGYAKAKSNSDTYDASAQMLVQKVVLTV